MDGELLYIDNTPIKGIAAYKLERNKIYKDAGRNLDGTMVGEFIGLYPKILLRIVVKDMAHADLLTSLLDKPWISVKYYDTSDGKYYVGQYYSGDYAIDIRQKKPILKYRDVEVNLIPVARR